MPAGAPGAAGRARDISREIDRERSRSRDNEGRDKNGKPTKGMPFDPDAAPVEDTGTTFAGETDEEAKARRAAGGKSRRPEDIRVTQGGMRGTATAGVQTESNGRQTRGGLAI